MADAMTAYQPPFQRQGPATNCIIRGVELGWLSCTAYAAAMAADQATRGSRRPSGCYLRTATGDTTGGLMLSQMQPPLAVLGIDTELRTGSNVCAPAYAARRAMAGQAFVLQGNTGVLLGTAFRTTDGPVQHAVLASAVAGGTSDVPARALIYDPAADGRRKGIASGPQWWPWSLVLEFAAALDVGTPGHPRELGPGRFYALLFPPTPAPPVVKAYTFHVAARAVVRMYDLRGPCISGYTERTWGARASTARCGAPVHRQTCDRRSGAVTVKVTSGAFAGRWVRVGKGVTVTELTA